MFIDARRASRCRRSTASSRSTGSSPSRPTTSNSARSCSSTAATSTATPPRRSGAPGHASLNIDHHHDNTHFGTVNLVVPEASCTAEIVWDLMHGLDVEPTHHDRRGAVRRPDHRHRPLHVREHRPPRAPDGRRADRRRRRRRTRSTGASTRACRTASWRCSPAGWPSVERYDDGRLTVTALTRPATSPTRAPRRATPRASIDHLRAVQGTAVAALIRDRVSAADDAPQRKVSLRASDDASTSRAIARAQGGGGHRQAAGFSDRARRATSSSTSCASRSPRSCREPPQSSHDRDPADSPACSCTTSPRGSPRTTSWRGVRRRLGAQGQGRPRRDARSVRDRAAAGAGRPRDAGAALPDGAAQDATRSTARFGAVSSTGDPEGEIAETGVVPDGDLDAADRPGAAAPAGVLGGQGRRAARLRAGAGGDRGRVAPSARSRCTGSSELWRDGTAARLRDRVLVGDLRAER